MSISESTELKNVELMSNEEREGETKPEGGALIVGTKSDPQEGDQLSKIMRSSLDETERAVDALVPAGRSREGDWHRAREIIENFRPVPWFIWRVANFVYSKSGQTNVVPEGMVMGLRRLMFAAASDAILGSGKPVNNVRVALTILRSDIIAAVSVIHAVCRKLSATDSGYTWRPILDDAILRAQLGYFVGERNYALGPGRGMLAGFSGRAGLAILLAAGGPELAAKALERMATGEPIGKVGVELYGCDPLQISSMMLSASGCGKDSSFGTVHFSVERNLSDVEVLGQKLWLGALIAIEKVRLGRSDEVSEEVWNTLNYSGEDERRQLADMTKLLVKSGTDWSWLG